jgi:Rv0078B-related antitoxin
VTVRTALDPLRQDDLERARRASPEERARQALDLANFGIMQQRAAIRARFPGATDDEIERRLRLWLARDERWRARDG